MYNILIADDEPVACRNLSAIINKFFNEFEVTKIVSNGQEAFDYIDKENKNIDVLFSDIRMPKLDGITLVHQIKMKYPQIIMIIISGYSDFSYARSAMQNGVSDYLLKPLVPSIVRKLLVKIKKELDKLYFDIQTQYLKSMYIEGVKDIIDYKKYFPEKYYYIAAFRKNTLPPRYKYDNIEQAPIQPDNLYCHPGKDKKEQILVVPVNFIGNSDFLSFLKKVISINNEDNFITMTYYPSPIDTDDFKKLIRPLLKFMYNSITLGKTQLLEIGEKTLLRKYEDYNQLYLQIINSINNDDLEATKQEIHNLFEFWGNKTPPQIYLENTLRKIIYSIFTKNDWEIDIDIEYLLDDLFTYSFTLKELENNFLNVFINQVITNNAISRLDTPEFLKMITTYIDRNYKSIMNMNIICNKFGLSQPYLSKIFRKYQNDTFTHYLTKVRMNKAKELMNLNANSSIKDIAEFVGYQDQFYFSRVFTNYFGLSPSAYFKEIKN